VEQLNMVGKRSGAGFVTHKEAMVNALSKGLAERLMICDFTIGRKGLLGYLKALSGSNIVKIVPNSNGSASEMRASDKRLKVVCGSNTSYLEDNAWVGDKAPFTFAEVRISPDNSVKPNMGSSELAEAISRTLPFTAKEDTRPILQSILFEAGDGKLKLVSADGFRLAVVNLDYDETEGKVLIHRDELRGIAGALRKAKRVKLSIEASGDTLEGTCLVIDTETTRYKWRGMEGTFPNYQPLIPTEFNLTAQLDTVEALKAVNTLKATSDNPKEFSVDLTIGGGQMIMANTDEKGEAIITADADSEGFMRVSGNQLADVLKAFGGMVDFQITSAYLPMLFSAEGFKVVVMPMMSDKSAKQHKADKEAKEAEAKGQAVDMEAEAIEAEQTEPVAEAEAIAEADMEAIAEVEAEADWQTEAEAVMEAEAIAELEAELEAVMEAEPKRSRSRKRDKVAVA